MSRFDRYFPRFMYVLFTVFGVAQLLYGHWLVAVLYAGLIFGFWWVCNRWPL